MVKNKIVDGLLRALEPSSTPLENLKVVKKVHAEYQLDFEGKLRGKDVGASLLRLKNE